MTYQGLWMLATQRKWLRRDLVKRYSLEVHLKAQGVSEHLEGNCDDILIARASCKTCDEIFRVRIGPLRP